MTWIALLLIFIVARLTLLNEGVSESHVGHKIIDITKNQLCEIKKITTQLNCQITIGVLRSKVLTRPRAQSTW